MNTYKTNITTHSTLIFCVLATVMLCGIWGTYLAKNAEAADGIFGQINFQGKLVGADGTNVADGDYDITFTLYDSASGGTNLWDETQTVSVTDGIFRVSLGSVDTTIADVDFNTDNLFLGIQVEADAEMTPRVRFTAVPYAFNAEKVNGLTVTNTSDNPFASTTTLKIGDGKTVQFDNGLRFTGTDSTQFTFPTSSGTIVTLDSSGTLTNKTIGSTGLIFSGATTDITTGENETLTLTPNGNGYVNINPVAGGYAALVVDKLGNGDIFTASASGTPRFSVTSAGGLRLGTSEGGNGHCLLSGGVGGAATWGSCGALFGQISGLGQAGGGITFLGNTTTDLLIGGTASSSAKFGFLNVNSGNPTFAIRNSSGNNPATLSVSTDGDLTIAATLDVIVGSGTGDINILPGTDNAIVDLESTGDFLIQDNGTTYAVFTDDGNIGIGTTAPVGKFHLEADGPGTTALMRINALSGSTADLFTASASGTPIFTITNAGEIRLGTDVGTSDECLKSGGVGSAIVWGECGTGGEIGGSWTTSQGAVFPNQATTLDVLVGGTATSSAKFGVLGIQSGTPTASVSAQNGDGNALILRSTGVIETANKGALTIGSTDTGDIILSTQGSNAGVIRINTASSTTPDLFVLDTKSSAGDPTGTSGALYMNSSNKLMINEGGTWKEVCNKIDLACGTGSGAAWSALTAATNDLNLSMSDWTSTFTFNSSTGADNLFTFVDSTNNTGTGYMMSLQTASGSNAKPFRAVTRGSTVIDTTTTGGVTLGSNFGNGNVLVQPNAGGQAALIVDKYGNNDIFTASASGTTQFVIANNGNVGIGTTAPTGGLHVSRDTGHRTAVVFDAIGGITSSDIFTASSSGTTRFSVTRAGGIKLGTSVGSLGNCLLSGGSGGASTWGACASVFTQISGLGQSNGGITFLGNTTTDFLVGGTASNSAKFAVLGMNNGSTPTASVSATSTGNAVYLSGDGSIQTVRRRNLTVGGSSTGAIQFAPNNTTTMTLANGNVGIGTSTPIGRLNVTGDAGGKALAILNETGSNDILAASSSGTTRFVVKSSGNVGIGLSNPTAGKFVISDSGAAPGVDLQSITATTGVTATGVDGLQIDYATAGTTASADNAGLRINVTSNNSGAGTTLEGIYIGNLSSAEANASEYGLRVGTGWDVGVLIESGGIQVSGGSITYSSGNRPARKMVISPEYPGAVLFGDGSNNTGSMTSDYVSSGDRQTYYEWNSSEGVIQDYTIVVRFTLPDNFAAWSASTPIVFDFVTETTSASNNQIDINVYLEGGSVDASDNDNVSGTAATWTTTSDITTASLGDCNAAGETCVVEFLMQSVSDNYVRVGDITLNYLANF